MAETKQETSKTIKKVPVYCYQCVSGPDLLTVKTENGIATEVEPNFKAAKVHPGGGKVCVKAYGLVQKTYNPHRLLKPMKRTNPKKGRHEDPGFVEISWDEAMDLLAGELKKIRDKGLLDESGLPRVAASFGGGGTPTYYMGTFPAFLSAWGAVDLSFGSGQGVKCVHSEHLYGELWHRAFTVSPDTPNCNYILSFGANTEASGGVAGVWRHAAARVRGAKRVQIEPHLSTTGAASAEWVPIKPKTDPAFMFAMIHVMLHEETRDRLDLYFLRHHTGSPYLIGPGGYFLRDKESHKPLLWDTNRDAAVPFDTPDMEPALEGDFTVSGLEIGADDESIEHTDIQVSTTFTTLIAHVEELTPEWAEAVCDIRQGTIRRITKEFLDHAHVGETMEIDGEVLPFRPVAIALGKTVNNGWGGYECCWGRTLMACLVGALEVPGGTLGTTVRLNRPATSRQASVRPNADGFLDYPMNPTDKENWISKPQVRNAHSTLVPLSANSPWSQALGPTHLAWMFSGDRGPKEWPRMSVPELWFVYRTNPAISFWDTEKVGERISEFPYVCAFTYVHDETNHMADLLLPECTDLESTQLIQIGGTKFMEQFWDHEGFALRQPAVEPQGETREFTDIATELAARVGLLDRYNKAINRGAAGVALSGEHYDFALAPDVEHSSDDIWEAVCRSASAEVTDGKETDGLQWYKEHGYRLKPMSRKTWYLFDEMRRQGIRFEMPYQERLLRIGEQLKRRLHEQGIEWWDEQLKEYEALPSARDVCAIWEDEARDHNVDPDDVPFWVMTSRLMQYSWGSNTSIQLMDEVASNLRDHKGVVMNTGKAREMGIEEGDIIEVYSHVNSTKGRAILRQGIRPDCLLIAAQLAHWKMPYAKDMEAPSMNLLTPMSLRLTDATGSGADLVRVAIRKLEAVA